MRSDNTKGVLSKTSAERPSGPPRSESGSPRSRFVFVFCPRPSNAYAGCRSSRSADTRNRPGTMPIRETDQAPFLGAPAKRKTAPPNRRERVRNAWVDHATFRPCYARVQALGESIVVPSMSKLIDYPTRWAAQTRFGSGTRPFPVRSPVAVGWGEPSCRAFGGPFRHACSTLRSLARHGRPKRPRPFG